MTDDVQPTQEADQPPRIEGTLSVQEAAAHYGVTEKTIRRRIKSGSLHAVKHAIAEGFEWRVYPGEGRLDNAVGTQTTHQGTHAGKLGTQAGQVEQEALQQSPELLRALDMIDRLQQEASEKAEKIAELTGAAAHWQTRAIVAEEQARRAEEQVRLLMAPKDEPADVTPEKPPVEPEPPAVSERVSWWRRLFS